jgi:hypothetical protein
MLRLVFVFGVLLLLSFQRLPNSKENVIFDRIAYIYNLKNLIDEHTWKGFADKKFDLPLVYYTDSICYVANPTEKFINSFKPTLAFEKKGLKIFRTARVDNVPFHMETSMTFGDGAPSAYNHRSPFMNCSSFEITHQTVPDVNSTEQWATMVIHEYFHGYQFKHQAHMTHFEKHIAVSSDTLKKIYNSNPWFKESVDKENKMLLEALKDVNNKQVRTLIDSFFVLRDKRRVQTKLNLNFDIVPIEQSYETMEGTARYVEHSLYGKFAKKNADESLLQRDSAYRSYEYFTNYSIDKDPWLYLSDKTDYFYATGFNLVRLMDKFKIEYKTSLFKKGGLSLEEILKQKMLLK